MYDLSVNKLYYKLELMSTNKYTLIIKVFNVIGLHVLINIINRFCIKEREIYNNDKCM